MSNNILFKKGSYADFKEKILGIDANGVQGTPNIKEGALYLTTDEGGLYLGVKDANNNTSVQRIQGSVLYYDTLQQFTEKVAPPYSTDVIYFIASENALVRWDPTIKDPDTKTQVGGWVQLNPTAPDYSGAITNLDTKIGAETTRATSAEAALDAKISENTAAIGANATAIAKKANQADLEAEVTARGQLATTVTGNTQKITDLDTKIDEEADRAKSVEQALDAKISENTAAIGENTATIATKANQIDLNAEISAREQLATTVSGHTNSISNLGTQITGEADRAKGAEQALSERITQNVAAIGENATAIASKASQADLEAEVAARAQLGTTVAQHTSDISNLDTKITGETNRAKDAEVALDAKIGQNAAAISQNATAIASKASQADLEAEVTAREQLEDTVTGHTNSISNLGTQITAEVNRAKGAEAELNTKITENAAAISQNATAIAKKADKTDLEAEVAARTQLATTVSQHTKDITNLGTQIGEINKDIESLESKNSAQDTAISGKLSISGAETMAGELKMGDHKITGLKDGSATDDAATVGQLNTQVTAFTTSINSINTNVSNLNTKVTNIESGLAGTGISIKDKTITLQNNLVANKKKITGLKDGEVDSDAATVGQLNAAIAANDAMTFKGTLGTGGTTATLPTSANVGDTYKVCVAASYATGEKDDEGKAIKVAAKIGDLFINAAATDKDAPKWEHISSGYEARYAQHLGVDQGSDDYSALITINDGVSAKANDIILASASKNIQFKASGDTITATIVWDTF